ncbi:4-coumarate-ligase isoform 6 [Hyphodiscus hymeniophilus]|uniref:4-coumarate-ligase isoform 6 n=1 Tax=Hyphodiscus hymeniophilus TaxID=353542 RepID=A0A9P7AYF9_9HELO|nr:4-coumarate-ligase isoform 6 [Hyphodiscus hymeniophilus]
MPIHSRWTIPLDLCSFQTYLLGQPGSVLSDKVAFLDADRPDTHYLTQKTFRLWCQRLAIGLRKAGLEEGDRVLLFSGNNIWFPVVFVGVLMAGGIFTGANPGYVARELAYQLKDSGSKFLLCADASLDMGIEAAKSIGMPKDRVFRFDDEVFDGIGKSRLAVRHWIRLFAPEAESKDFAWREVEDPKNAICCLNYSSGTTGVPKGVMITHYNYIANSTQFAHLAYLHPENEERTKAARWLCYLPMYHAMAQTIYIGGGPKRGIPVYIMKKFDFVGMLEAIQKYKITTLHMVPPIVVALAKSPLSKKYDLSSVIEIGSGAAPLGGDAINQAEALWPAGDRKLKQGWGMTEATCSLLGWDPNVESVPDSVGELNANCHAKIMDMHCKNEVRRGERGEIWVQAPNIMKGYWHNEKATAETFVDGPDGRWMRTGDIAYVDDKGRFYIVDRMKELIKVKGNQVAPAELEALLLEHPQISDAAVVGVTIQSEEVPRAYVVVQEGNKADAKGIQEWLANRVSRHKRIVGGCVFVETIPKNPSGKILRKQLRERAQEEVGDKKARL